MDILKLYQDYSIPYADEEHRHYRPGWVNTPCKFCTGNEGMHLGYCLDDNHYYCYRCGWHPINKVIAKLLGVSDSQARTIIKQYGGRTSRVKSEPKVIVRAKAHRLPSGTRPMELRHKEYLAGRGFDPDWLEQEFMLMGTGPIAKLDNLDFKHRIIAPIPWEGQQVSFQGRDITDRHKLKYITCPKDRELMFHKDIVYYSGGFHNSVWADTAMVVEGVTDVWRLGYHSLCTFGIEYTRTQVRLIAKLFKRVAVIFDDDPQAIVQANKLVAELRFRGVDSWRVDIQGDPGSMKQDDADHLIKTII